MDDCNVVFGDAIDGMQDCSESSMDDCNYLIAVGIWYVSRVQIPLWTIVT